MVAVLVVDFPFFMASSVTTFVCLLVLLLVTFVMNDFLHVC